MVEKRDNTLGSSFYARSAADVACDLLGVHLISTVGGARVEGRIVEVEAYPGPEDPASHAASRIGRTARNSPMFGPPGTCYIHLNYGIHWCLNAVTTREGYPAAVLIRALEPVAGQEVMKKRRGHDELTTGPARLTEALGVDDRLQGHVLDTPPLWLTSPSDPVDKAQVSSSPRIGISRGQELELRFFLSGNPYVSR